MPRIDDFLAAIQPKRRKAWAQHLATVQHATIGALLDDLPADAWSLLLTRVLKQIDQREPVRGWPQALDLFNEARAYRHLRQAGCTDIAFIVSDMAARSPDIRARRDGKDLFCEVKSLRFAGPGLTPLAEKKLRTRCDDGVVQLAAAKAAGANCLLYLILDAEPSLIRDISLFLQAGQPDGIEIVVDALN